MLLLLLLNLGKGEDSGDDPFPKVVKDTKRHVVQLEILVLFVIAFNLLIMARVFVLEEIDNGALAAGFSPLANLMPLALLLTLPLLVRVTNPGSLIRSILTWGLSGGGLGGTIGGALAAALTGGFGAPGGALIGTPIGFAVGAVLGPVLDPPSRLPAVLTQGGARTYLIEQRRRRYPWLGLRQILDATDRKTTNASATPILMFEIDGVTSCMKEEVEEWLKHQDDKRKR